MSEKFLVPAKARPTLFCPVIYRADPQAQPQGDAVGYNRFYQYPGKIIPLGGKAFTDSFSIGIGFQGFGGGSGRSRRHQS